MYHLPQSTEARHRRYNTLAVATAVAVGGVALLASCGEHSASTERTCYTGTISPLEGHSDINRLVRSTLREHGYDPAEMDGVASTQQKASGALSDAHGAAGFVYPGDTVTFCIRGNDVEFAAATHVK